MQEGFAMDEVEMMCRDANGNVYREAFKILGFDGLYFILAASGGILFVIFVVIYCSNSKEDTSPQPQPPARLRPVAAYRPQPPPQSPQYANYANYGNYGPGVYRRF